MLPNIVKFVRPRVVSGMITASGAVTPLPSAFRPTLSLMLTDAQRKYLRRLGHDLKPVVLVGNSGMGPNLVTELDGALAHHELVKVRARVGDRAARDVVLAELAQATRSDVVQRIGHVALFYRANTEKTRILLPDG